MKLRTPFSRRHCLLTILALSLLSLAGCATPRQGPELPQVTIGVAEFSQPRSTMDMLAGYMPEDAPRVPVKVLGELDTTLLATLRQKTSRTYASTASFPECAAASASVTETGRLAALKRWVAIGQCMKVDFIIVPQVYHFQERDGGEAGATSPAGATLDFFLVDVTNAILTSRSHFDETQLALTDNLLDTGKFISRGGRWISAIELAREGMEKAIKDMGL